MRAVGWGGATLVAAICAMMGRPAAADDPGKIVVYSGYGTPLSFIVSGRVLEDEGEAPQAEKHSRLRNLVDTIKTLESDEITNARVAVKVGGETHIVRTDDDGVWRVEATGLTKPLPVGDVKIEVELLDQTDRPTPPAIGTVHVLADAPGTAVISDFDDTIADSGVTNKGRLIYRTLTRNAADMEPVPGVAAAFATAAQSGSRGFFYVSGSPQNLYVRINAFLALNEMPPGPILLKNIGSDALTEQVAYKKRRIRALLGAFPKLRFLLVGDSGEHDPEIYAAIRKESPARIAGIIIRVVPGGDNDSARFTDMVTVDRYDSEPGLIASLMGSGPVPNEGARK